MDVKVTFKSGILFLIISNLGSFFQYLIQILLGRYLTPLEFGIYNTTLSIFVVVAAFSISLSFVTAQEFIRLSSNHSSLTSFIKIILIKTFYFSTLTGLCFALLSEEVADYFALKTSTPILICSAMISCNIIQAVFIGMLQGQGRYSMLSLIQSLQIFIRFILVAVAVVVFNYSYTGALLAILISYLLVIVYLLYYFRDYLRGSLNKSSLPPNIFNDYLKKIAPTALIWAYMGIISSIDIPLVKHFHSGYQAGIYSAGAVLGRITWFLPGMLVFILFPEVVRSGTNGKSSVGQTILVASATFVISFGIAIVFTLFHENILSLFMGEKYIAAGSILSVVSFSMAILAILSVLYHYGLAKKMTFFLYPAYLILVVCITLIYWRYNTTPLEIAAVFLIGLIITLLINSIQFFLKFRVDIFQLFVKSWESIVCKL